MAIIRTVKGDISPEELGICYPHEHLLGHPPDHLADSDTTLDNEAVAVQAMQHFQEAGGRALVEMSTPDYHRDAAGLRRISERTGIHIICATGYNKDLFSAPFVEDQTIEDLTAHFIEEVTTGIGETGVRAGVLKAASTLNAIRPNAEKVFRAVARAHHATGAPISTHTQAGTMAPEQIALLRSEGVDPGRVILGHLDRKLEADYLLQIAETGAYLSFDQISKEKYYPDHERITHILHLVEAGFGKRILLSGDLARRSYWPEYDTGGGPGFTYLLWRFVPWLRSEGVREDVIEDFLIHNPARALALSPLGEMSEGQRG